jgi:hypothetical protein
MVGQEEPSKVGSGVGSVVDSETGSRPAVRQAGWGPDSPVFQADAPQPQGAQPVIYMMLLVIAVISGDQGRRNNIFRNEYIF